MNATAHPLLALTPDAPAVVIVAALVFLVCLFGWAVAIHRGKRARVVIVLGWGAVMGGQLLCENFTDFVFVPFSSAFLTVGLLVMIFWLFGWAVALWRRKDGGVWAPLGNFVIGFAFGSWIESSSTADPSRMMAYGVLVGVMGPTLGAIWANKRQAPP